MCAREKTFENDAKNARFFNRKNTPILGTSGTKTKSQFRSTALLALLWLFAVGLIFCMLGDMGSNNRNEGITQAVALSQDSTDNYYTISTVDEFLTLCNDNTYWDKNIKMIEDIEIKNRTFTPIGGSTAFSGIFDGQGHTITISNSTCSYVTRQYSGTTYVYLGIFGRVAGRDLSSDGLSKVINLKVHYNMSSYCYSYSKSASNEEQIYSGGIVAGADYCKVKNCMVTGNLMININVSRCSGNVAMGAFVGCAFSTIRNCAFTGALELKVNASSSASVYANLGAGIAQSDGGYWDPENCGDYDTITNTILNFSSVKYIKNGTSITSVGFADFYGTGDGSGVFDCNNLAIGSGITHNGYGSKNYICSSVPSELKYNKEAFTKGTTTYPWANYGEWDFDNAWTFIDGENDGLPVLSVFYASRTTEMTITGAVECANSILLLTVVDENEKIVQEISFVTGQANLSAVIELAKNATYKILVTKPFGSVVTVAGATTQVSSTVWTFSTGANDTMAISFVLNGSGKWTNTVVV